MECAAGSTVKLMRDSLLFDESLSSLFKFLPVGFATHFKPTIKEGGGNVGEIMGLKSHKSFLYRRRSV